MLRSNIMINLNILITHNNTRLLVTIIWRNMLHCSSDQTLCSFSGCSFLQSNTCELNIILRPHPYPRVKSKTISSSKTEFTLELSRIAISEGSWDEAQMKAQSNGCLPYLFPEALLVSLCAFSRNGHFYKS